MHIYCRGGDFKIADVYVSYGRISFYQTKFTTVLGKTLRKDLTDYPLISHYHRRKKIK